jgi:ankyrin repeat protein
MRLVADLDRFLLAQLHLDSLISTRSPAMLRKRLAKLPSGSSAYDKAYAEAMDRIMAQDADLHELAIQTLSWITCAQRPLTVDEIRHALAVEDDSTVFDEDNISDIEDIVSTCAGLVVVDEESHVVRLVHYTTQEFFDRERTHWLSSGPRTVANACTTYLAFDTLYAGPCENEPALEERLRHYALYRYAATYWADHTRASGNPFYGRLWSLLLNEAKTAACYQVVVSVPYYARQANGFTGLHLAAYSGLDSLVTPLIEKGIQADSEDEYRRTPLLMAVIEGHTAVARLLLARDDVDIRRRAFHMGRTALHYAAAYGHVKMLQMLLETDRLDPNLRDQWGRTPLMCAAEYGHPSIMKALLAHGDVDMHARDGWERTPLHLAVAARSTTSVNLLLNMINIQVNAQDHLGGTPLHLAARRGNQEVIALLIDRGDVQMDLVDIRGRTALMHAIEFNQVGAVKLLL